MSNPLSSLGLSQQQADSFPKRKAGKVSCNSMGLEASLSTGIRRKRINSRADSFRGFDQSGNSDSSAVHLNSRTAQKIVTALKNFYCKNMLHLKGP